MRVHVAMAIHMGIGSWTDAEYVGVLFPKALPAGERLQHYARWFDCVEVNSSYYATPRREIVAGWAKQTPKDFIFDVKLHRAFSQSPAKAAAGELPRRVLHSAEPLLATKKLGAFLLVLPPTFRPDNHTLAELDAIAEVFQPHVVAVELRHHAWVQGTQRAQTFEYFRQRKLVWVAVDMPQIDGSDIMPAVDEVTHPKLAYVRLHGRNKNWLKAKSAADRHQHAYSHDELAEVAGRVKHLAKSARQVHVFANNHARDYAPKAALALQELLGVKRNADERD